MNGIWFFDDWMLERRDGLEREWGKPTFLKEIFSDYYPRNWPGYGGFPTMFYDERLGKYVLYVVNCPGRETAQRTPGKGFVGVCAGEFQFRVATDDPTNWPNPRYTPVEGPAWEGFEDVVVDQDGRAVWGVCVKPLAGTPLAGRGYVGSFLDITDFKSWGAFSEDGLRFDIDRSNPWFDPGSDMPGWPVWNPQSQLFHVMVRRVYGDRRIAMSTTADFKEFTRPVTVLHPDAIDRLGAQFYHMSIQTYEDMFIGLPLVYSTNDHFEEVGYMGPFPYIKMNGRVETELAYSYNGSHWIRGLREPFIGVRDHGLPGCGTVYCTDMLRTRDNRLLFVAPGDKGGHAEHCLLEDVEKWPYGPGYRTPLLYELRLDGFSSLRTWGRDGMLRTKTVKPTGSEITLNVRTMDHSAVRVQMLDAMTAQPIPGYTFEEAVPISGDELFAPARWKERQNIGELIGRLVRFEVKMRDAQIYAMRNECEAHYGVDPLKTLW